MSLAPLPLATGRVTILARRNPVAKLAAMLVVTFGLLGTLDPVALLVALAIELAAVPLFGVRYLSLARRGWPVLAACVSIAGVQLLFGTSAHPVATAVGLAMRVVTIALPGVLTFATLDPTDLADALVQQLRVPARFAVGALAALRLLPLLADDLRMLALARRARGVAAGRSPAAHARLLASTLFALLVVAIRRGTRLATAMDARGFAAGHRRTTARVQRFAAADAALVAAGFLVVAAAMAASIASAAP